MSNLDATEREGELLNILRVTPEQPLGNLWATARHPWEHLPITAWKPWATWKQSRSNCKETFGQPLGNKV